MKIGIVGTGAMGAVYAALLGKAGHEVWAIDRWREHLDAIDRDGLRVSGASGNYVVDAIRVGDRPADAGPCDLWIVATKAADVDDVLGGIAPLLRPDDVVMPFQNGLGAGERVARHVPEDQIVVGIAEGFGSSIPDARPRPPQRHAAHPHRRDARRADRPGAADRAAVARRRVQRPRLRRHRPDDLGEVPLQRDAQRPDGGVRRHRRRADGRTPRRGPSPSAACSRPTGSAGARASRSRSTTRCAT